MIFDSYRDEIWQNHDDFCLSKNIYQYFCTIKIFLLSLYYNKKY